MILRPNTAHVSRYLLDGRQRSEITTFLYFEARIIDPYKASLCESLISRETEEVPKRTFWCAMMALLAPTRSMADRTSTFPEVEGIQAEGQPESLSVACNGHLWLY